MAKRGPRGGHQPNARFFCDPLGTSRGIDQAGQTTACYEADYYPFGGERVITDTCAQNYKFTGKERDSETALDYFGARYYGSNMGRFTSGDEGPLRAEDPQSMNRYAYARNNPLRFVEEGGYYWVEYTTIAGKAVPMIVRETSSAAGWLAKAPWARILDYAARRERGDTNNLGNNPFWGGVNFPQDELVGLDLQSYSLSEGIALDRQVFSAFAQEFHLFEQENVSGSEAFIILRDTKQLQEFSNFHTAYRYAKEIQRLQAKLEKTTDQKKRGHIQIQIEKRKSTPEYKQYGERAQRHLPEPKKKKKKEREE